MRCVVEIGGEISRAGAVFDDVELMRRHTGDGVKVKAAGGIASFEEAQEFIRLGTSRLVKIMKQEQNNEKI